MKKKAPMEIVESGVPMDRVATDILGELPITEKGNKYFGRLGLLFEVDRMFPYAQYGGQNSGKINC